MTIDGAGFPVAGTLPVDSPGKLWGSDKMYWDDIPFPVYIRTAGPGIPALGTVTGNLILPVWQVNDYYGSEGNEIPHGVISPAVLNYHIHMVTAVQDGTDRYVKWEVETYYANVGQALQGPSTTTMSGDYLIPANTPIRTHFLIDIGDLTITGSGPGTKVWPRLKRIASAGTAPSADPFCAMLHAHVQFDQLGSRQEYIK